MCVRIVGIFFYGLVICVAFAQVSLSNIYSALIMNALCQQQQQAACYFGRRLWFSVKRIIITSQAAHCSITPIVW